MLQLYEALWGPVYEGVLSILGTTGVVLPIGDPKHGQPNATTFTTVGEEQVTFTWSEAPNSFDTKLDMTDPDSFQGVVPVVDFNGTDEEADTPDAAYWTRDDSGSAPFSVGLWIKPSSVSGDRVLLGKFDSTSASPLREWQVALNGDEVFVQFADESGNWFPSRQTDALNLVATGVWRFVVMTYDSAGGASAADTITIYADGASEASTANNNASYVAMEDLGSVVHLGFRPTDTPDRYYAGGMAGGPLGPFFVQKELTADEVLRLYELGRRMLAL